MSRFKRSGELCKRAGRKPTKGKCECSSAPPQNMQILQSVKKNMSTNELHPKIRINFETRAIHMVGKLQCARSFQHFSSRLQVLMMPSNKHGNISFCEKFTRTTEVWGTWMSQEWTIPYSCTHPVNFLHSPLCKLGCSQSHLLGIFCWSIQWSQEIWLVCGLPN